jgi:hypothetical protein
LREVLVFQSRPALSIPAAARVNCANCVRVCCRRTRAWSISPEGIDRSKDRSSRFPAKKTAFAGLSRGTASGEMLITQGSIVAHD